MKARLPMLLTTVLLLTAACGGKAQDEEARKHWLHELGGPFFISREPVQNDLHLSDEQKQKLQATLSQEAQQAKSLQNLKSGDREPALRALRQTSYAKLEALLQQTLTADQLARFQQLKLQYDIPSVMLQPAIDQRLQITDEQRTQFVGLMQEMQNSVTPLLKAAKSGGNPQEILPKVIKLRQDCQAKIEALLTDPQKKQWDEMIGRPLVIW